MTRRFLLLRRTHYHSQGQLCDTHLFQHRASNNKRLLQQQRYPTIQQIKNHENDEHLLAHHRYNAFTANTILQQFERQRTLLHYNGINIPSQYLAVENQQFDNVRKSFNKFQKTMNHVVATAGEQRYTAELKRIAAVQLTANTIKLVLNVYQRKNWLHVYLERNKHITHVCSLDLKCEFRAAFTLLLDTYLFHKSHHRLFH